MPFHHVWDEVGKFCFITAGRTVIDVALLPFATIPNHELHLPMLFKSHRLSAFWWRVAGHFLVPDLGFIHDHGDGAGLDRHETVGTGLRVPDLRILLAAGRPAERHPIIRLRRHRNGNGQQTYRHSFHQEIHDPSPLMSSLHLRSRRSCLSRRLFLSSKK